MSNHLIDVSATPNSIANGASTKIDVEYESDDGGVIQIASGGGFAISPHSINAPASPNAHAIANITITRGTATTRSCRLIFTFLSSSPREVFVEIT